MLSAKELVKAVKEPRKQNEVKPDTGPKLLSWDGKLDDPDIASRLKTHYQSLSQPRVSIKSSLSEAVWDEEHNTVIITRNTGKQDLGPLLPEEALYLLENNSLYLKRREVPLSLQAAYTLLMSPETGLTRQMYLVYSKLTREGFKLVRADSCCDEVIENDSDEETVPAHEDIDPGQLEPLYGRELMTDPSQYPPDWLQDIRDRFDPQLNCADTSADMRAMMEDIVNDIVDEMEVTDTRHKRKLSGDDDDRRFKHARTDEFISLPPSPKYEPALNEDEEETMFCLRCLNRHVGGERVCHARTHGCFICGKTGHHKIVHTVSNGQLRQQLSTFLGLSTYELWDKYDPELVTIEECKEEPEEVNNVVINPFHESDDDDDVIEESPEKEIESPVVEIDDEDDGEDEIEEIDIVAPPFKKNIFEAKRQQQRQDTIDASQNVSNLVSLAIQHQVAAAQEKAQAAALPTKLVAGPNEFLCKLCDITCNTPEMLKIHENGQKHRKKAIREKAKNAASQARNDNGLSGEFVCDICHIECPDGDNLVQHFKGKRHLKAMTQRAMCNAPASSRSMPSSSAPRPTQVTSSTSDNDNDIMIVTEKINPPTSHSDDADEDIEIITGDEKTRKEIFDEIPNCSSKDMVHLNKPLLYLLPSNTWTGSSSFRYVDVRKLMNTSEEIHCKECNIMVAQDNWEDHESGDLHFRNLVHISSKEKHLRSVERRDGIEEVDIIDDDGDNDEIILVEEEDEVTKRKKNIYSAKTRPFRGLYPSKEYMTPLASIGGIYSKVKNFGYHTVPRKPTKQSSKQNPLVRSNNKRKNHDEPNVWVKRKQKTSAADESMNLMGIAGDDNLDTDNGDISLDLDDMVKRARFWIDTQGQRKEAENMEPSEAKTADNTLNDLAAQAKEWSRKTNPDASLNKDSDLQASEDFNDLGNDDHTLETFDESSRSSSNYSDDVSAHPELRNFKYGPLGSLWTMEEKISPLICPEMAGSMREIFSRLRMDPKDTSSKDNEDQPLDVSYNVFLVENYKKNRKRSPDYRIIIQNFGDSLPSKRQLADLDQRYPDKTPFLFAIVSGGTVSFFCMDRVELPSYYRNI